MIEARILERLAALLALVALAFAAPVAAQDATSDRIAVELVNPGEGEAIAADRAGRRTWLEARDYRVIDIRAADVERDLEAELVRLQGMIEQSA